MGEIGADGVIIALDTWPDSRLLVTKLRGAVGFSRCLLIRCYRVTLDSVSKQGFY